MKKIKIFIFISVSILILNKLKSDNRILIYLNNVPQKALTLAEYDAEKEKLIKKIDKLDQKTPSQASNKLLKYKLKKIFKPSLDGFISLYSGYLDYSDRDGRISFPLRHTEPKIYIAISPRINLVKIKGKTISHAEYIVDQKTKTEIYKFEKRQDNKGMHFWTSSKQPMPADKKINPLTVVILSKPKNFYVPIGDFLSNDSKQIVLNRNIYVLDGVGKKEILLNTLDIKRFFESIEFEKQKAGEIEQEMIFNA